MDQQTKINLLNDLITPSSTPRIQEYYDVLEKMGDTKYNYVDYMTTAPVYCDFELNRIPNADYELCCALLTMILREDYCINGSFRARYETGQVNKLVKRMITLLKTSSEATAHPQWVSEYETYNRSLYGKVRYLLGTKGTNSLIVIGANPSTAVPECPDRTISTVANIINADDCFDSFAMINLYPQRATNPNDLHKELDPMLHRNNCKHIHNLLSSFNNQKITIWAAWGHLIHKRPYLKECLLDIVDITNQFPCEWIQRGDFSNPHHPLYLRKGTPFYSFDVQKYAKEISKTSRVLSGTL